MHPYTSYARAHPRITHWHTHTALESKAPRPSSSGRRVFRERQFPHSLVRWQHVLHQKRYVLGPPHSVHLLQLAPVRLAAGRHDVSELQKGAGSELKHPHRVHSVRFAILGVPLQDRLEARVHLWKSGKGSGYEPRSLRVTDY